MNFNNFNNYSNLNNHHQLIPREQNYVLDRKFATIHSNDRDFSKWPNANEFEIHLPQTIKNVQSLRLVEISLPVNYYTFSNINQNTKFKIQDFSGGTIHDYIINIQEGFYNPEQLSIEIQNKLILQTGNSGYITVYDEVSQKFIIGNIDNSFTLCFDYPDLSYDISYTNCNVPDVFNRYVDWGFPSFLGFKKEKYYSVPEPSGYWLNWLEPALNIVDPSGYVIKAPRKQNIYGDNTVYMEVDKYNSMDELDPYIESNWEKADLSFCCTWKTSKWDQHHDVKTTTTHGPVPKQSWHNKKLIPKNIKLNYNGRVNSAFAKIPMVCLPNAQLFDSRNGFLCNISCYEPPIERIEKLKFKFRKHDGQLFNFQNSALNFTLAFDCLQDEIPKKYTVRNPYYYYY
jgi:hypothetical protein